MAKKRTLFALMLALISILLFIGCTPQPADPKPMDEPEPMEEMSGSDELMFTAEEVASFNGKDGRKAYVIYDGYVYDVTNHPQWQSGTHGGNAAGTDITDKLDNAAPHGASKLSETEKIGKLEN